MCHVGCGQGKPPRWCSKWNRDASEFSIRLNSAPRRRVYSADSTVRLSFTPDSSNRKDAPLIYLHHIVPFAFRVWTGNVVSLLFLLKTWSHVANVRCRRSARVVVLAFHSLPSPPPLLILAAFCALTTCDEFRFQLVANLSSPDGYYKRFFASFNSYFRSQRQSRSWSLGHSIKHEPILQSATPNGNPQRES